MATEEKKEVDLDEKDHKEPEGDDKKQEGDDQEDYRGKLNAQNRFLKEEGYEFKDGKWQKPQAQPKAEDKQPEKQSDLSPIDLYALMEAKVPQEDVQEVVKAAQLLGKSIGDALKDTTVQAILKTRQEHRTSANAANTRTKRPSNSAPTDAEVLADASKGKVPEKGSQEAEQLFWARRGGKKKN